MSKLKDPTAGQSFNISWKRLMFQGAVVMLLGMILALSSAVNSDAIVLSARQFSWLPASGFILLILGLEECLEAFFAKESREFHQNLQVGILDTVVGGLIIFSVSGLPQGLSLMIAAFLIVRGLVRITLAQSMHLPHVTSLTLCGIVSVSAGILIYFGWNEGWFLSLCLNIEIAFRGWSTLMFSLWLKKKKNQSAKPQPD